MEREIDGNVEIWRGRGEEREGGGSGEAAAAFIEGAEVSLGTQR